MTLKLAIVGGGIAGRSIAFALSRSRHSFEKVFVFDAPAVFSSCSLNSTAIVAPRGISSGHSELGDLLMQGFETFSQHVKEDSPLGVSVLPQFTGTKSKLDQFKLRYPHGELTSRVGEVGLRDEHYVAQESAYQINPDVYLSWLKAECLKKPYLKFKDEFVTEVRETPQGPELFTQTGEVQQFDHVIFCGGVFNSFWGKFLNDRHPEKAKSVQGAYLEFREVRLPVPSFSLTLDGANLIYNGPEERLLLGSTTLEGRHLLAPAKELQEIYESLREAVTIDLPDFDLGEIRVGLREKASKRRPYLISQKQLSAVGGLYKNGYSLSLELARRLVAAL